jgi:hypothetical protein
MPSTSSLSVEDFVPLQASVLLALSYLMLIVNNMSSRFGEDVRAPPEHMSSD